MAFFGVQLAHLLTVLLVAACVLLCLVAVLAQIRQPSRKQVLQPVYARPGVRRVVGRHLAADPSPLPSRDPPGLSPLPTFDVHVPDRRDFDPR